MTTEWEEAARSLTPRGAEGLTERTLTSLQATRRDMGLEPVELYSAKEEAAGRPWGSESMDARPDEWAEHDAAEHDAVDRELEAEQQAEAEAERAGESGAYITTDDGDTSTPEWMTTPVQAHDALHESQIRADLKRYAEAGARWDALPLERQAELHRQSAEAFRDEDQLRKAEALEAQAAREKEEARHDVGARVFLDEERTGQKSAGTVTQTYTAPDQIRIRWDGEDEHTDSVLDHSHVRPLQEVVEEVHAEALQEDQRREASVAGEAEAVRQFEEQDTRRREAGIAYFDRRDAELRAEALEIDARARQEGTGWYDPARQKRQEEDTWHEGEVQQEDPKDRAREDEEAAEISRHRSHHVAEDNDYDCDY